MELARDQLGWSSIGVTQRYAHLYPGAAEEVAARLDRAYREGARGVVVWLGRSRRGQHPLQHRNPLLAQGVSEVVGARIGLATSGFSDRRSPN